jgi:hypothetical protein
MGGGSHRIGACPYRIDRGSRGSGGGDNLSDKVKASRAETMKNPGRPPPTRSEFPQSHDIGLWAIYRPAAMAQEAKTVEEEKT